MIRYMVVLESGETSWGAYVPDLPGCVVAGETREEAVEMIRDAVAMHIEDLRAQGLPVPPPTSHGHIVEIEAA